MGLRTAVREGTKLALLSVSGFILMMALVAFTPGCKGGGTGDSPTEPVAVATPTPAPAATPTPAPVAQPTPDPKTLWWVEGGFGNNGEYSFKNVSGDALTWTVYKTSFDDQELVLWAFTMTTRNKDYFAGTIPDAKCYQLDAQQGVVKAGERATAAPFASAFINGYGKKVGAANARDGCTPTPCTGEPTVTTRVVTEGPYGACSANEQQPSFNEVEATTQQCSKRRTDLIEETTTTCDGQATKRQYEKVVTTPCECTLTCEQRNPEKGAVNASVQKVNTKHPGTPEQAYWYGDMDNGQGNNEPKKNACEGRGGVWLGDDYNIPNDGSNQIYDDVCRVTTGPAFPGGPGADADFIKKVVTQAATPDKYSVTVTLNWSIAAGAAQTKTFKIIYNGSFVKKQVTVSVACGEAKQGSLVWGQGDQYNDSPNYSANDGHVTGMYSAQIN